MFKNTSNNKRIAKNVGMLYFRMIFQLLISLYTSRIILQTLGFTDFGIYNVVGGVVGMFDFLNGSMGTATSRFLTFELGKNENKERMHLVFSTALIIHIIICLLVVLLSETIGLWYIENKLVIPEGRIYATRIVYQCTIVASILAILNVPYNAAIVSHEKMNAFAYISILEVLINLIIIVSLQFVSLDRLIVYAICILLLKATIRIIYVIYCNKVFQETRGRICFDRDLFKKMASFAAWIMNGSLSVVCYTQGLNLLLNAFGGPIVNAARGIAVQVQSKIMGFCSNFQMAMSPQIIKKYASGEINYMHSLVINSSKFSFLLIYFLSFPIILEVSYILKLWLVEVPQYTRDFVVLTLCIGMISSLQNPINTAIHATGNIKRFQLIEGTVSLLVLPVAYIALKLGYNPTSAFVIQLCIFVILQVIRVFIVCPAIRMRKMMYFTQVVWVIIKVVIPSALLILSIKYFMIGHNQLLELVVVMFSSCIIIAVFIYSFALDRELKLKLNSFIIKKINSVL